MNGNSDGSGFRSVAEPIIRKFIENIENPFVWTPLGLFVLCVLAYPLTDFKVFPYLSIAFLLIAFGADWLGRWQNRQTPPEPIPQTSGYRDEIFKYLASVQTKAVGMLEAGKECVKCP